MLLMVLGFFHPVPSLAMTLPSPHCLPDTRPHFVGQGMNAPAPSHWTDWEGCHFPRPLFCLSSSLIPCL